MSVLFRSDGWVKSVQGPAVPGAQIFVCTQPANAPSSLVPVSPSPQASVFSDPGGLVPVTQPIITDGFGHYSFYATAGIYTVLVYQNGLLQQTYPDQSVGGIGSGGGVSLVAGTNITIVGSVISATGGGSGPALQVDGTPNSDQALLDLDSTMMFGRWADNGGGKVTLNIAEELCDVTSVQLSSGSSVSVTNPFNIEVTNASLTSNVITFTTVPANFGSYPLDPQGAHLFASNFSSPWTFLNGQRLPVLTYNPFVGTMTCSFTHANVGSAATGSALLCATFVPVISYAGAVAGTPLTPFSGPPTNTGALWVQIAADWGSYVAKSTNASDSNWVNIIKLVLYN